MGGPTGHLLGALRRQWNNRKYVVSKLRFPPAKKFGTRFQKCRPRLLKGRQVISLPGAPAYLGPALITGRIQKAVAQFSSDGGQHAQVTFFVLNCLITTGLTLRLTRVVIFKLITVISPHFYITFPSTSGLSKLTLSFRFTDHLCIYCPLMCSTCSAHIILLDMKSRKIFGEEYNSPNYSLYNFFQPSIDFSFLDQIFFSVPYFRTPAAHVSTSM
jgi:hypothetical protein